MSKEGESPDSAREKSIDYELIRVLLDDKKPAGDEEAKLMNLKLNLGDRIFSEAIYELTHITVDDAQEAKSICSDIMLHKRSLAFQLERDVGLVMPALDYMTNVRNKQNQFMCMDSERHEELIKGAITDEKTEAYSSALLYSDIEREIERSKRYRETFTLIFADIDRFKQINTEYGHIFGDKTLSGVSGIMKASLRKSDSVYRYGGDEFVIMLPETDETKAKKIALKIRIKLKEARFASLRHEITSSFGIVSYDSSRLNNPKTLLTASEEAAYRAKDFGGNSVCIYKDDRIYKVPENTRKRAGKKISYRFIVKGEPVVGGLVSGKVFKYEDNLSRELRIYSIADDETEKEYVRIKEAILKVEEDLDNIMSLVENELEKKQLDILRVHKFILKDKALLEKIEEELKKKKLNSEAIVKNFFEEWEGRFHTFETPELRSKASDIADLGTRILRKLAGIKTSILDVLPEGTVLFSARILPTDIVHLKKNNLRAIVTSVGSRYSHAAILAKALGIPFVSKIDKRLDSIPDGADVIVDGYRGRITVNPALQELLTIPAGDDVSEAPIQEDSLAKRTEYKGRKVNIYANIESEEDAKLAARNNCDGVGLTRLEYVYIRSEKLPHREALYEELHDLFEPVKEKHLTIRLLDIGGDKLLPYMQEPSLGFSKMGMRGVRFLLKHKDILLDELVTILRLSMHLSLNVLIPMVCVPEDVKQVKRLLLQASQQVRIKPPASLKVGAMIEVPGAVFAIDKILRLVDFISIGSNDLVQYVMAADREEAEVSNYYEKGNTVILDTIKEIIRKADKIGVETSLCGELAGDFRFTEKLLACGLSNFSVAPYLIPRLRKKIQGLSSGNR